MDGEKTYKKNESKNIMQQPQAIGDDMCIEKFYEPVVTNETKSCMTGFEGIDFHMVKKIIPEQLFAKEKKSPLLFDEDDFSGDNSVDDPDYKIELKGCSGDVGEGEYPDQASKPAIDDCDDEEHYSDQESEHATDDGDNEEAINDCGDQNENNINIGNGEPQRLPNGTKKYRQIKRNYGKSYFTKTGKAVTDRKCVRMQNCRKKCHLKITFEEQKSLFDAYWRLGSYNARILYISGLIECGETLTKKTGSTKNRQFSNFYYVEIEGNKINICQNCFCMCYGETKGFLRSVIKKKQTAPESQFADKRGSLTPKTKLPDSKIEAIKNHIQKFPSYESHYCRRDSSALYLCSDLNISKMYNLYCKEDDNPVSITKYSEVFHAMNLKFKQPKLDTCSKCDEFKIKLDFTDKSSPEYTELKERQTLHHEEADLAYECKRIDKDLSKANENIKTYVFDLQQILPTPFLRSNTCYYKRQLYTFNLTIHDCETNETYCYMWHEGIANRGANEIASCLFEHLKCQHSKGKVDKIVFYSDSCAGQNKNTYVSCMFLTFMENNPEIKSIEHKFLVPGHTHMECDVDHATIERKKKSTSTKIHHPRDWYQLVSLAGKKNKFKVIEMDTQKFFDFGSFSKSKLFWRKFNENKEKFYWSNVKWLRYKQNNFGFIEYKTSLKDSEAFYSLDIKKRGVNTIKYSDIEIIKTLPLISKEKKADLISILDLIDPIFHSFYKNLNDGSVRNIDPDIIIDDIESETI